MNLSWLQPYHPLIVDICDNTQQNFVEFSFTNVFKLWAVGI